MKRTIKLKNKNRNIVESSPDLLKLRPVGMAVRATLLGVGLACGAAEAALITVNSSEDALNTNIGSTCTLRKAVESVNQRSLKRGCSNTGARFGVDDAIEFEPQLSGSTITLAGTQLVINGGNTPVGLTLRGSNVTINPDNQSRAFDVESDNALTINDLTISNGSASSGAGGAVVVFTRAQLSANNVDFTDNYAGLRGGAIISYGNSSNSDQTEVTLRNCTISGNSTDFTGGGLDFRHTKARVYDSIISNNTVTGSSGGGGINIEGGDLVLERVTLDSNESGYLGGGLLFNPNSNATLDIKNSTISNNVSRGSGGGLELNTGQNSLVTIANSTISSNIAEQNLSNNSGGGLFTRGVGRVILKNTTVFNNSSVISSGGTDDGFAAGLEVKNNPSVELVNTIVAGSVGANDCRAGAQVALTVDQFNIIQDGSCATSARAVNPRLKPLADNGGTTKTHLLEAGSPAINGGDNPRCQPSDQRGKLRPRFTSNACDIGAVEATEVEAEVEGSFFVVPIRNGKAVIFEL